MWTLRGMWSEQVAPSPLPPRPTQEQETSEEDSISSALAAMFHKTRVGRIFSLHLSWRMQPQQRRPL